MTLSSLNDSEILLGLPCISSYKHLHGWFNHNHLQRWASPLSRGVDYILVLEASKENSSEVEEIKTGSHHEVCSFQ